MGESCERWFRVWPEVETRLGVDLSSLRRSNVHMVASDMEVDVVLVTAAEGEDEAVLAVADGRLGEWEPFLLRV